MQAVEQLGADQAIPSRILELMKVEGLTRHNVASHLQVLPELPCFCYPDRWLQLEEKKQK